MRTEERGPGQPGPLSSVVQENYLRMVTRI